MNVRWTRRMSHWQEGIARLPTAASWPTGWCGSVTLNGRNRCICDAGSAMDHEKGHAVLPGITQPSREPSDARSGRRHDRPVTKGIWCQRFGDRFVRVFFRDQVRRDVFLTAALLNHRPQRRAAIDNLERSSLAPKLVRHRWQQIV
jgi:hypothetical protein